MSTRGTHPGPSKKSQPTFRSRTHQHTAASAFVRDADRYHDARPTYPAEVLSLVDDGVPVTVLGFHEHASWAVNSPDVTFVDLEDIPGVFQNPLPRVHLDALPEGGAWLQPFRPLKSLLRNTRD